MGIPIAALLAALALAVPAMAASKGQASVKVSGSSLGKILVNGANGRTLYVFSKDTRNKDNCFAISGCASTWPALTTKGKPLAGTGAKKSLLGTTKLPNGKLQVTYAGHPLYVYSGDFGPHQTDYVGFPQFGGTWYAINANGGRVK
jgi:predicted lipoprotein with Yx(FWY)xxD motif